MLPPDVAAAVREGRPIPELTLPADVCPSLHAFPTTAELGEWYVAVMMEKIRPLLERHVRKPLPPNLDRTCGLLATLWAMYEERDALAMPLLMAVYQERDTLGEVLRCATSA
jgi:hypothetical protein